MKHSQFLVLFLSVLLFSNAFTINDQDIANQSDKTRFRAPQIDELQVEQEFKPQQNFNSNPSTQQYEPEPQPDVYATHYNPQQNVYYNDQNNYYHQPQQNYQAQYDQEPVQQTYETAAHETQDLYQDVLQPQPEYTQQIYEQVHQQEYVPEPFVETNENVAQYIDYTYQEVPQVKPEYTEQVYEQVNYVQEEAYQAKPEHVEQVYYAQEQQAYEEVNYQENTQAYQYEEVPVYQNQYEQVDSHVEKPIEQQNVQGYVEVAHQQTQEFVENNQMYNYQETHYVEEPSQQEETYQYQDHEEHNIQHYQEQSTEEVSQYSHTERQQYDQHDGQDGQQDTQQYTETYYQEAQQPAESAHDDTQQYDKPELQQQVEQPQYQQYTQEYDQQDTQQYTETYYQETQQPAEPVYDDTQYEQYQAKEEYVQPTSDNTQQYYEQHQQVNRDYQQTHEHPEQQSQYQEECKDEYAQYDEHDYEQEYAQQQQVVQPVEQQYQEYEQYQAKPEPVEQTSEQYQQQYQGEPAQQHQQYDQYEEYEDDKYDEDVDEYYLEPKPEIQQNSDYANNQYQYHQETVQQTYQQENQYVESTPDVVDQYYERYSQQADEVLDKYVQETVKTVETIQKEIVEAEVDSHQTQQADEKPYVPEPKPVETQPVYETPAQPTVEHVQPVQQIQQEKPVQAKQQHLTKAITETNYISNDEDSYDVVEKFFVSVVGPTYKQVKENYYLNLAIKGGFSVIWVAILISVVNKLVFSKPTDQTLLGELKSLKSQLNTLATPSSSFISELKNEFRVLNQNVARNEATTAALISDKKKIDNFVVEFQHEVMESHKAIWKELNHIGKTFSAPSLKIPAKTKKVTNTGGAPLSSLLGDETNANTPATSSSMMFGQQNSASSVINEKVKANTVAQVLSPNSPPDADSAASTFTPQQVKSVGKPVVNISSFGTRGGMPLSQMLSMNGENTPISGIEASIVTNPVNPFKVNKIKPIGAPKSVF